MKRHHKLPAFRIFVFKDIPLVIFRSLITCTAVLFLAITVSDLDATDNISILKLRQVQSEVEKVVAKNTEACVAISDGVGFGSGVIISRDGLVLTAGHVMGDVNQGHYKIFLSSGRTVRAKPLGKNLNADTGMCQIIDPGPFPFAELESSPRMKAGDWVVSLGYSGGWELGRTPPVRTGRIIAQEDEQIVTDAVLIGGDSGGPLFNLDGNLIGIHSSIGDSVAENRHVRVGVFRRDWVRLKRGESWGKLRELNDPKENRKRGRIGIKLDLSQAQATIRAVNEGMPAEEIGLEVGDIITEFDGIPVNDGQHLISIILMRNAGDVCPIVVRREGKEIRYEIILR